MYETNSTLILYSSRYGSAQEYAQRLTALRDCDIMPAAEAKLTQLRPYQTLIWIGSVYMEKIQGIETLQRHYAKLQDARICVMAVGAAPDEVGCELRLPGELTEVPLYYARGRFSPAKLNFKDSMMLKMLKTALARKPDAAPGWMAELLQSEKEENYLSDIYLEPLLDFISGR